MVHDDQKNTDQQIDRKVIELALAKQREMLGSQTKIDDDKRRHNRSVKSKKMSEDALARYNEKMPTCRCLTEEVKAFFDRIKQPQIKSAGDFCDLVRVDGRDALGSTEWRLFHFIVRRDGVWLPPDNHEVFQGLFPDELDDIFAVFSEIPPQDNQWKPVLPFPCTMGELCKFLWLTSLDQNLLGRSIDITIVIYLACEITSGGITFEGAIASLGENGINSGEVQQIKVTRAGNVGGRPKSGFRLAVETTIKRHYDTGGPDSLPSADNLGVELKKAIMEVSKNTFDQSIVDQIIRVKIVKNKVQEIEAFVNCEKPSKNSKNIRETKRYPRKDFLDIYREVMKQYN